MATTLPTEIEIPAPEAVRDQVLDDIRLLSISAGLPEPDVSEGSDHWVDASAMANATAILAAHVKRSELERDVLTATGAQLDEIRESLGIPELEPSSGSGLVTCAVSGSVTVPTGLEFVAPSGARGRVTAGATVTNGQTVPVVMVATGDATNLATGTKVRWASPPVNLLVEGTVASPGFTGGKDTEDDERKRERILNRLRFAPAAGNWSDLREKALEATIAISDAFVFPALGGPASVKVAVAAAPAANGSREVLSGPLDAIRAVYAAEFPDEVLIVVQSVDDLDTDVALLVVALDGHWLDDVPWPSLVSSAPVTVSASPAPTATVFTTNATVAPTAGKRIAWWDAAAQTFTTATIASVSGAGPWAITLSGSGFAGIAAGDYISPAPVEAAAYATAWKAAVGGLGPGENTTDGSRLPRARRRPDISEGGAPVALTLTQLAELQDAIVGISDISYAYRSVSTPTVPGATTDAPRILKSRRFGVYAS